jgi:uncharacterized protein YifN (PemK superfamily)
MPLSFVPGPGSIVICDFAGYLPPEMVKKRRVVVLSPPHAFKGLSDTTLVVVPLSEVRPNPAQPWHHEIAAGTYAGVRSCWAKSDLVAHVALARLDRIFFSGRWVVPVVHADDLSEIRRGVARAIGLHLT